ncbi:PAS domain-containing protein [bacterium]|nr:PAS domain-containing protein [bacterium]MBU1937718.1 PAS domain-containing protein [bacterium]
MADWVGKLLTNGSSDTFSDENSDKEPLLSEALLNEPMGLLAWILDHSPDAFFILDGYNGKVYFSNRVGASWLTTEDRDTILGKDFDSLFPDSERQFAAKLWQDNNQDEGRVFHLTRPGNETASRLVEFQTAPIIESGKNWIILTGREIESGTLGPQRELRAERDRMNTLIRSLRDGLVLLSKEGEILFANPAMEQMFEADELPNVCREWLDRFRAYDQVGILGFSSPYEGQTLELLAQDGRTFLVTRSYLFESKKKTSVMLIVKDITELKLLQWKGHQLEMELLRESKLAEFGTMAAGIAHNLNGPLTSILGFCDLVTMTNGQMKEVDRIRAQAILMKDTIANLMQKSRHEQNTEPHEIQINELIETEWKFLHANMFFKHEVEKILELDETTPEIFAVYSDVSQAVGNLLRNAIDALYHREEKRLIVRTRYNERYVFVDIIDTGVGIKTEDIPKLFKPFFTTKPMVGKSAIGEPTGTGLGLSTTRSILARYGAEVFVDSAWQEGSTFTIRFPLTHQKASD